MQYVYFAELEADPDGGFLVTFPDVPEAITHGEDRAEALASLRSSLSNCSRFILSLRRSMRTKMCAIQARQLPLTKMHKMARHRARIHDDH